MEALALFLKSTTGKILIAGTFAFVAGASASMWATGIYYRGDIAALKLAAAQTHDANSTAALKQFQNAVKTIASSAGEYSDIQKQMTASFDGILKDFRNVKYKAPLPVDCKPDAERLRVLTAAVTAANTFSTSRQQASRALQDPQ